VLCGSETLRYMMPSMMCSLRDTSSTRCFHYRL